MNNFVIQQSGLIDKQINIPIELSWDYEGLDDGIDQYQENVTNQVIGPGYDFEVNRFPHAPHENSNKTDINYEFNFYSGGSLTLESSWKNSYLGEGFTTQEIFYYSKI